jgi:hypothetical protein
MVKYMLGGHIKEKVQTENQILKELLMVIGHKQTQ